MKKSATAAVAGVLSAVAAHSWAVNRCILPSGAVLYTEAACASAGAKLDREVTAPITIIPAPPAQKRAPPAPTAPAAKAAGATPKSFQKAKGAPIINVCYDPRDARAEPPLPEIEAAIRNAMNSWNAGCNVTYEYAGICAEDTSRTARPVDYKVWWASWDPVVDKARREHAVASASPRIGVALNRDMATFARFYRRAIVHEFGHVLGAGHSDDPGDVMYASVGGGGPVTPSDKDMERCNRAVEGRYGVK